jgi:glycosyltransferase involved in cell wall biosynthesis
MSRAKVVRIIARLNTGGPARHVTLLSDGLSRASFDSLLVYGALAEGEGSLEHLASASTYRSERVAALGRRINPLDDWRAFISVLRILWREKPDIVHTHTSKAGVVGRLAALLYNALVPRDRRCAIIHTFHGHVFNGYFGHFATATARLIEKILARGSDAVIAISPLQAEDLVRRHRVVPPSRIRVVPLGLRLNELLTVTRDAARRSSFGFAEDDVVFGFVGRLVPVKSVDLLLAAFASARTVEPRVRLLIVGDGEMRGALEGHARSLGVAADVRFLGWRHDLPVIYAAMDAVVLTSINEGTPVALIEGAAAGLPCVATQVGGVADVVTSGVHGLLVPPGDVEALSAALLVLARSPADRRCMGDAARRDIAVRYNVERLVRDIEELYGLCLARRRRRGMAGAQMAAQGRES